jgi:hypothetical protein
MGRCRPGFDKDQQQTGRPDPWITISSAVRCFLGAWRGRSRPVTFLELRYNFMSNCEQFKHDLPLYFDGVLSPEERSAIDSHLVQCPLCRQRVADLNSITRSLRQMPAAPMPEGLARSLRNRIIPELDRGAFHPVFRFVETPRNWVEVWLVPSLAGGLATVLAGITVIWFMVGQTRPEMTFTQTPSAIEAPIFVAGGAPSSSEFVSSRKPVSGESPSLNPQGALVALTETLVGKDLQDDEVVVVADVFENGSARIAEVVEPSRDKKAVKQLETAFESELAYAPFVPADVDARPETMRVIFKIRSINVYANAGATNP